MKKRAEIFGENLERILLEKKISRKEFAINLDISQAAVGMYINGKREPSLDKLFEIAEFLKVSVASLISDNKYNNSVPNIEDKLFEQRFNHVLKLSNEAGFIIEPYDLYTSDKGNESFLISIPSTFQHVENDGTISIISGFETFKIKDKTSLVEFVELAETQAVKQKRPLEDIFRENLKKANPR